MLEPSCISGFDWDEGNTRKNDQHGVSAAEAEQVFLNQPLVIQQDTKHSGTEQRWHALGVSDSGRRLHITFTLRFGNTKIRVISARDMHRKERQLYEQKT
jgi:uncharacterized DUF497 family protein